MPEPATWREVESEMHVPARAVAFFAGAIFVVIGIGLFAGLLFRPPANIPFWAGALFAGTFLSFGLIPLGWSINAWLRPPRVRHAAADVLPNVPSEPVPREGSVMHGRLTHELIDVGRGAWQFRPAEKLERMDRNFMLGFGIPFLIVFAGLLTWSFHKQNGWEWTQAAVAAIGVTLLCGGSAFGLIALVMRAGYRRLGRLDIAGDGGDLELDLPQEPDAAQADLAEGLRWIFVGDTKRQRLSIPRRLVAAVQLCPWEFRMRDSTTWGVQGLLVLTPATDGRHPRLPIVLTSDCARAARILRQLADVLEVPFLFNADAAGWQAEKERAKSRPPLKCGGMQS